MSETNNKALEVAPLLNPEAPKSYEEAMRLVSEGKFSIVRMKNGMMAFVGGSSDDDRKAGFEYLAKNEDSILKNLHDLPVAAAAHDAGIELKKVYRKDYGVCYLDVDGQQVIARNGETLAESPIKDSVKLFEEDLMKVLGCKLLEE